MSRLTRIDTALALACPGCQARLTHLPLEGLAGGEEYACPHCEQQLRIPPAVVARLQAQREAGLGEFGDDEAASPWWRRYWQALRDLLK